MIYLNLKIKMLFAFSISNVQTIPRSVWLDKGGKQLMQWPVEELEKLRGNKMQVVGVKLWGGRLFHVKGIKTNEVIIFRIKYNYHYFL